jgi:uncharacterized protein (TIGR03000 family)
MNCSALSRRAALMLLLTLVAVPALWSQVPDQQENRATVIIRVHPEATLTVEGKATRQRGERRTFVSPPLEPGKKYSYTFVAEWMPRNNYETYKVTRKATVEAGKKVEIDMSEADLKKGDVLFIRFVPTPPEIIDAMMKLAKVGENDVVYDLGCGDGALVIAAVKQFHAKRGVGVDLDPERIKEANAKAKEASVSDKVEFRRGNVLEVKDLSDATVVMLYMSDELNNQLRPILQKQLKPGSRIVSHRFTMGEWKPDKTEEVDFPHDIPEEKRIHLWTIKKDAGEKEEKNHSGK